ncbi:MAG: glycosyltransferase family 4 protein [Dorea sp.]|jgi:glycosyltransferase involved in cell wall biosynthesis|nr:glycosyltransferase family 4 protein [Dorea sp.]
MEKLFLFGTGKISKKYTQVLKQIPVEIEGYIDNDENKWGDQWYDKNIYSPNVLNQEKDSYILIACAAKEEIRKQLTEMGKIKKVVSFGQILGFCSHHLMKNAIINMDKQISTGEEAPADRAIVIDNFYGNWGGAEDWCHVVASALIEQNNNVYVIENKKQPYIEKLDEHIIHIDTEEKSNYQIYQELIQMLIQIRPFVLFNVWNSELLWAAVTIKYAYPEDVLIVSSVLNDGSYEEWYDWADVTDQYVCISSKIQRRLVEHYKIKGEKTCQISPFIEKTRTVHRRYSTEKRMPLKIGYPCRLEKSQKRADLIPVLLEYLESRKVHYVLNIAGEGACEREIKNYIEREGLCEKVKLHGKLTRKELSDFLDDQDIYLNFSEYEGTSLTMLEAMASGCVPIVTNVSGVDDFIEPDINGLIADVGDLRKIAEHIAFLDKHRNVLSEYGYKCVNIVHEKCGLDKYIANIQEVLKSLEKVEGI